MKQIFALLLLAATFAACSDDEGPVMPPVEYDVISFETNEGMVDRAGKPVTLPGVTILGFGNVASKFSNVLCGKGYMAKVDANGNFFDDQLFSTADGMVNFGSYFTDFTASKDIYDTWGGFSLSRNFDKTPSTTDFPDYSKQFSAWATKGANGTDTFAIAYCNDNGGKIVYDYSNPKIVLKEPRTVGYFHLANATVTGQYKSSKPDYYFKVIATGYRSGSKGRAVEVTLVNGTNVVPDWVKVDCSSLGEVDEIRFAIQTNDMYDIYPNCPSYFCLDEIGVVKPVK